MSYLLFTLLFPLFVNAQVLSPSGKEFIYSYSTEFLADAPETKAAELARRHAFHLYGLLQSPTLIADIGLDPELVGGLGAPRADMRLTLRSVSRDLKTGLMRVQYTNQGKILLHKTAARKMAKKAAFAVPLPANISTYYDARCVDPDYPDFDYFWYFYDPFQQDCEYLTQEPDAHRVIVNIRESRVVDPKTTPRLDLLRGNNGNGDILSVYVVHGFSESYKPKDDGRVNFEQLNSYLRDNGFDEDVLNRTKNRPLHLFTKTITLANGKDVQIQIKHQLADAEIDTKGITFAKFFKEAVETADVVIYAGHSGLGDNLDIAALEKKVGGFNFNPKKRQIFFFDACTSYGYYLASFAAEKTKAKIDVVTYALPSYFDTGEAVMEKFFEVLFDPDITDMAWLKILKAMEEPLDGATYLLNVGGF